MAGSLTSQINRCSRGGRREGRSLSTSPDEDLLILMKRVVFAWLIADGDMHLKNMAVVKIGEPGNPAFRSVRLASVYDTLTRCKQPPRPGKT